MSRRVLVDLDDVRARGDVGLCLFDAYGEFNELRTLVVG
jgi:hypothetical protein